MAKPVKKNGLKRNDEVPLPFCRQTNARDEIVRLIYLIEIILVSNLSGGRHAGSTVV